MLIGACDWHERQWMHCSKDNWMHTQSSLQKRASRFEGGLLSEGEVSCGTTHDSSPPVKPGIVMWPQHKLQLSQEPHCKARE